MRIVTSTTTSRSRASIFGRLQHRNGNDFRRSLSAQQRVEIQGCRPGLLGRAGTLVRAVRGSGCLSGLTKKSKEEEMRRLPVYLLLDTSGSMSGEPIEAVNGVQILVSTLRQDPYALETAYLSVIAFDSSANKLLLTGVVRVPDAEHHRERHDRAGRCARTPGLAHRRGSQQDYGRSQGRLEAPRLDHDRWQSDRRLDSRSRKAPQGSHRRGRRMRRGPGRRTRTSSNRSRKWWSLDTADSSTIKAFFKWVSASVSTGSQKIDQGQKEVSGLADGRRRRLKSTSCCNEVIKWRSL